MRQAALALVLAVLCGGCAVPMVVTLHVPAGGTKTPALDDILVVLPSGAAVDLPVGVFAVGPYTQSDMEVLRSSLAKSAANLQRSPDVQAGDCPRLVVVVRSLMNQYGSSSRYQFGCIAYCLADHQRNILHQGQFYVRAEGHGDLIQHGTIRNFLNERVTKRILNGVLAFYDGESKNVAVKGVFDNFEDAVRTMPIQVSTVYGGALSGSVLSRTAWHLARRAEPIDWKPFLQPSE